MATNHTPAHLAEIYGPGVAICTRPGIHDSTLGFYSPEISETIGAHPVCVAGPAPAIVSAGAATSAIQHALAIAGAPRAEELRTYRDDAEFTARCHEAVASGERVTAEYPQDPETLSAAGTLNPASLVSYLNNKAHLTRFVSPEFTPERAVIRPGEALTAATPEGASWVLKAATDRATGGGLDIYLHTAGTPVELPEFALSEPVLIEEHLDLVTNWSIQHYLDPAGEPHFFGATEQRISPEGAFLGNLLGDIEPPPRELIAEARSIALRGGELGFRGICALDAGRTRDGRIRIFDLNFRICSPSCSLLFLAAYRPEALKGGVEIRRWNLRVPIEEALTPLLPAIEGGELIIISGYDTRLMANPTGLTSLLTLVLGADRHDAEARLSSWEERLGVAAASLNTP